MRGSTINIHVSEHLCPVVLTLRAPLFATGGPWEGVREGRVDVVDGPGQHHVIIAANVEADHEHGVADAWKHTSELKP